MDPILESLFKASVIGLRSSPRDLSPLRVLGDYYEERGHSGCLHACRDSDPGMVPLLSYLMSLGVPDEEARAVRRRWLEEVGVRGA